MKKETDQKASDRPGCLSLNTAYDWYHTDRQKVVTYVERLEAEIKQLKSELRENSFKLPSDFDIPADDPLIISPIMTEEDAIKWDREHPDNPLNEEPKDFRCHICNSPHSTPEQLDAHFFSKHTPPPSDAPRGKFILPEPPIEEPKKEMCSRCGKEGG